MKYFLSLILLFQSLFCIANSASPVFAVGSNTGSAYSSKDVDILKEVIVLDLEKKLHTAFYTITYHIKTDKEGKQIPLLFNAMNYEGGFKVWVDDKQVQILTIPRGSADSLRTILKDFGDVYHKPVKHDEYLFNSERDTVFSDYKYFEAPLSKGEHIIRVEYVASPAGMHETWVNRYDFDYSLWPASYWHSFGSLEIKLVADSTTKKVETNLGAPAKIKKDTLIWDFDKIPVDIFRISYEPKLGWFANAMVSFGPFGFAVCFTFILLLLNIKLILYERKLSGKWFAWATVAGGLVAPIFIFIAYFCTFGLIYAVIGDEASHHSNSMYAVFLYPAVAIVYFIFICLIDLVIKQLQLRREEKASLKS